MGWLKISYTLIMLLVVSASEEWAWGEKPKEDMATTDLLEGENVAQIESKKDSPSNETVLDDIVDEIISSPQGRSLGGFDDVYADPSIKGVLDSGDDGEARNLIKERLCSLGLMQCEEGEEVREKRPFVSPDELIYAQPVDIQPIGRPIASIPVRGPPRAYGAAKPVPYPSRLHKIPPKRVGFSGSSRPGANDKYGQVNYQSNHYQNEGGVIYGKPTSNYANENPYTYENFQTERYPKPQLIPTSQNGIKKDTVVQQHVHHHYVHDDTNKDPKVIIKPVAIPVGAVGHLSGSPGNVDFQDNLGFKPISNPFPSNSPGLDTSGFGFSGHQPSNSYDDSSQYPNLLNSYGNNIGNGFNKKESNLGLSNHLNNQGPQTFYENDLYRESKDEQFANCVCVNYDQCPTQEIISKREDLFLPIDPRNNKNSEIDALPEDQAQNATTSSDTIVEPSKDSNLESKQNRKKRETKEDEKQETKIESRLLGLAGNYGNNYGGSGNSNNKVQPTFGVSFGLPQASNGGYPINPYGPHPVYNPYGPAINSGGLNLGLISVNPLVALQVTKNDYGEKVVKPLVNLHVTPNEHVVNKLGHLFHEKKHYLLNKHEHYHHYPNHHLGYPHYKPLTHHYNEHNIAYAPNHPSYHPHTHFPTHYQKPYITNHPSSYHLSNYNHQPIQDYDNNDYDGDYTNEALDYNNYQSEYPYLGRSNNNTEGSYANQYMYSRSFKVQSPNSGANRKGKTIRFPSSRKKREVTKTSFEQSVQERRYTSVPFGNQCLQNQVCCRRPLRPQAINKGQCGIRHSQGINGRIKTPSYVDGDSEFGEYPWQVAILKKDAKESVYVCGGTLIDHYHIMTAAHCVKQYQGIDLRVRLGEWDVNHDVEFYPYIERDISSVHVHPSYYAGTLDNDLALLKMELPVDWTKYPHISPACLPDKYTDYSGQRCWTTGWGKDAFGTSGKYQNILKEVDVPVISHSQCQQQLKQTRLGYSYQLNPGFICAGGEEGKDACKGDGGGPMVCERGGTWQLVGVVSWGIGCGQVNVPGVYVKVSHYLDWIAQVTGRFSNY